MHSENLPFVGRNSRNFVQICRAYFAVKIFFFCQYLHSFRRYSRLSREVVINSYFGRVGRIASEEVVIHLIVTKCLPVLLYGLEACPLRKTDLNSLDFVVNRFFYEIVSDQ